MPFETVFGLSVRRFPEAENYAKASVFPNIAIFGRPLSEGLLNLVSVSRVILHKVSYELRFGPARQQFHTAEDDDEFPYWSMTFPIAKLPVVEIGLQRRFAKMAECAPRRPSPGASTPGTRPHNPQKPGVSRRPSSGRGFVRKRVVVGAVLCEPVCREPASLSVPRCPEV